MYNGIKIPIPLGQDGLIGSENSAFIQPTNLISAVNISYEGGSVRKEGGSFKYNTNPIPHLADIFADGTYFADGALYADPGYASNSNILAGCDWFPQNSVQRMLVYTDDGRILRDTGTGLFSTVVSSGLSGNCVPVFVPGGSESSGSERKLFMFNGANSPQVLSGDALVTSNISTPPADWSVNKPTFGVVHEGRLWAGGNSNAPHTLYYSQLTNHENFTGSGSGVLTVYPGVGERLIAAASYKGLLIVWKYPYGIYAVNTTDPDPTKWNVQTISQSIGAVSPYSWLIVDNDILFMDNTGSFQLLSGIMEYGKIGSKNLSWIADLNPWVHDNFNLTELTKLRSVYYPWGREAFFALPEKTNTVNNQAIVIDFNRPDKPRFRFNNKDVSQSLWLRRDSDNVERPYSGDDSGFIWGIEDYDNRSKDGNPYTSEFQTPHLDFGYADIKLATLRKNGQFLEILVDKLGTTTIYADIYWDGVFTHTATFNTVGSSSSLGSFILGTSALASDGLKTIRRRIVGSGNTFSVKFRSEGTDGFSVIRAYLYATVGDETIR